MAQLAKIESVYKLERKTSVVKLIGTQPYDNETLYLSNERFPDSRPPPNAIKVKVTIVIESVAE